MSRIEVLKGQPLFVKAQWWAITLVTLIYILPLLAIAIINPFWFRDGFAEMLHDHVASLSRRREAFLKPQYDKYRLFSTIKNS